MCSLKQFRYFWDCATVVELPRDPSTMQTLPKFPSCGHTLHGALQNGCIKRIPGGHLYSLCIVQLECTELFCKLWCYLVFSYIVQVFCALKEPDSPDQRSKIHHFCSH